MVDVSYQMILSTIQTIALVVGIVYYLTIMRNSQKNQELTRKSQQQAEETRKVQLLMQIHQSQDEAYQYRRAEIAQLDLEYESLEEFEDKLTRDQFVKWAAMINQWNILGLLLKFGYFDSEMLFEYLHATGPVVHWEKYKDVIVGYRERNKWHSFCSGMEYLAEEMKKYRDKQEQEYLSSNR